MNRKRKWRDSRTIKRVLNAKPEQIRNVHMQKSVLGHINIEYELKIDEIHLEVNPYTKEVSFSTFNYNYYQDMMTEEETEKLRNWAKHFIETSTNRLRLLL